MALYDGYAEQYNRFVTERSTAIESAYEYMIKQLAGQFGDELAGRNIVDIGCGQGELARRLADRGAAVTGVDESAEMLAYARSLTGRVQWIQDDAMTLGSLPGESAEAVVSCLMLMDLPDFMAVFRSVHRILQPGGVFVWLIMHPCFQSPFSYPLPEGGRRIQTYEPQYWKSLGTNTLRSTLGAYHRPLSDYLNGFMEAGFRIVRFDESGASAGSGNVPSRFGVVGRK